MTDVQETSPQPNGAGRAPSPGRRWGAGLAFASLAVLLTLLVSTLEWAPRVQVRWRTQPLPAVERQLLLRSPHLEGGTTYSYSILDTSPANLRRLVGEPEIEDTHGVDRNGLTISPGVARGWDLGWVVHRVPFVRGHPWLWGLAMTLSCLAGMALLVAARDPDSSVTLAVRRRLTRSWMSNPRHVRAALAGLVSGGVGWSLVSRGHPTWLWILGLGLLLTPAVVASETLRAWFTHRDSPTDPTINTLPGRMGDLRQPRVLLGATLFAAAYASLVAWFHTSDLWHTRFDDIGPWMRLYAVGRLVFTAYLLVVIAQVGAWFVAAIEGWTGRRFDLDTLDALLLSFFAGAGVWLVVMYVAGLMGLLYPAPAAVLTTTVVFAAYPTLAARLRHLRRRTSAGSTDVAAILDGATRVVPAVALVVVVASIYMLRGLPIAEAGYDARGHYVPYYEQVLAQHGTAPNDLWYHFWVSKGAGLHFLAGLLTDLHGPLLVSCLMVTMAMLSVVSIVRGATGAVGWGLMAGVLALGPLVTASSYWKLHLATLGMMAGVVWLVSQATHRRSAHRLGWNVTIALVSTGAVINAPPSAAPLAAMLGTLALIVTIGHRRTIAHWLPVAATVATAVAILGLNQAWTGLAEVTPLRVFHGLADQERLARYVSPYLPVWLDEATRATTGRLLIDRLFSLEPAKWLRLSQAELLWPPARLTLWSCPIALGLLAVRGDGEWRRGTALIWPAALLLGVSLLLSQIIDQQGSIERFYIFNLVPLSLVGVGCVWLVVSSVTSLGGAWNHAGRVLSGVLVVALSVGAAGQALDDTLTDPRRRQENLDFVFGRTSFRAAMATLASAECLAVSDFMRTGRSLAPVDEGDSRTKVWTLQLHNQEGCHSLPDVRIMSEMSNGFGARWHAIVFGSAAESLAELERQNIRYFYVDLNIPGQDRPTDSANVLGCVAYSPLFDPEHITERFRVLLAQDGTYLLTTDTDRGTEITEAVASRWAVKRDTAGPWGGQMKEMCGRLADYYATHGENWPVNRDTSLPPLRGWQ